VSQTAAPLYEYRNDEYGVGLELYYDSEKESGVGVFHGALSVSGFEVGGYARGEWRGNKFSVMTDTHDASFLAGYAEHSFYDGNGRLARFYSEGIIEGWGDGPYLDKPWMSNLFTGKTGPSGAKSAGTTAICSARPGAPKLISMIPASGWH